MSQEAVELLVAQPGTRVWVDEKTPFDPEEFASMCDISEAQGYTDAPAVRFKDDPVGWWDAERADWYLRRQGAIDDEIARVRRNADAIIARLEREKARREKWFWPSLQEWLKTNVDKTGKTVRLLHGAFKMVERKPALRVVDAAKALEWAGGELEQDVPLLDYVPETWKVNTGGFRDYFKRTGDIPPGCEVTAGGLTVSTEKIEKKEEESGEDE